MAARSGAKFIVFDPARVHGIVARDHYCVILLDPAGVARRRLARAAVSPLRCGECSATVTIVGLESVVRQPGHRLLFRNVRTSSVRRRARDAGISQREARSCTICRCERLPSSATLWEAVRALVGEAIRWRARAGCGVAGSEHRSCG
jgi:hypothetical protein